MAIDVKQIKGLVELMVENDLSRVELRDGDVHILLRRGQPVVGGMMQVAAPQPVAVAPAAASLAPAPAPAAAPPSASAPPAAENETLIRSPMVGTFYGAPEPGAAAFVQPGSVVNPDSVVCLIEAMKVFNEIKAECSGRVSKVFVKNAQAVEFDQPLFAVVPA
jgi:acetyl-CoA carboxylase biotin carboxyl carrier protein